MIKMDGEAWAAWGVLALGMVGALSGAIGNSIHSAFKNGYFKRSFEELSEKVDALEEQQKETDRKLSEIQIIKLAIDNVNLQVRNLRRDIIMLLRGKMNMDVLKEDDDEGS